MTNQRRCVYFAVLFVVMLIIGVGATPLPVAAALQNDEPVIYLRYDVQIDVREDGVFHVREEQEVLFNESLRTAFAEIPLDLVSEIRNIAVSEEGASYTHVEATPQNPGTFNVSYEQETVYIDWMYEETTPGEERTFVVEYDVMGGLWVYEDGDILEWRAVPADRGGVPILSSTLTVNLPPGSEAGGLEADAFGPPFNVNMEGTRVVFTADREIADGEAFHVMVGFAHGLVDAVVQPWQRAEDSADLVYRIPAVEIELEITEGGAVQVTERQTVSVEAGVLYGGARTIPLAFVDGLLDFSVSEGEAPYVLVGQYDPNCESCAWVEENRSSIPWVRLNRGMGSMIIDEEAAGEVHVGWTAPPLVRGEETTFVLRYTAVGALQVTEEAQTLAWTSVSGFDVPVEAARLVVDLPPDVTGQNVQVDGGVVETMEDGRLLVRREGSLAATESWQVRVAMAANATASAKPLWQQEMEAVAQEAEAIRAGFRQRETQRARQQLAFGVGGAMLLVGGLLLVGLIWYQWGRDRETVPVPEYLSDPPSDLPPGIVAYLLDEKPTPKGVLASLFHLATLGLLRIKLGDPLTLARNWDEELVEGQTIETSDGDTVPVPGHMAHLFNGLREHLGMELKPLPQLTTYLPRLLPQVYYAMGQEATQFFAQLPGDARRRWLVYGQWIVLGGVGLMLAAALIYASRLGWIAAAPAVALAIVGAAMMVISRWMPQRSPVGVEEAARWRAFEQYLRNLKQYGDQEDAQRILDRHFAYAVALDVEEVVLAQAAQMDARMPTWTQPVILDRTTTVPGGAGSPSSQGPLRRRPASSPAAKRLPELRREGSEVESGSAPSLQGMAEGIAAQLDRANRGLTHTLRQAVGDISDTPFQLVWRGATGAGKIAAKTSLELMEAILDEASSGGGSSSFRGSSGGSRPSSRSSWGSSRSSGSSGGRSRSSRSSSGRSSSSRRSGGGGRRGFGR